MVSNDRTARVWDLASGRQLWRFDHAGAVSDAVFSPDSKLVATASGDRTVHIWSLADGRETQNLSAGEGVSLGDIEPALAQNFQSG